MAWPENYDAMLSVINAINNAEMSQQALPTGTVNTVELEVKLHLVDMWTRVAQVHATMLVAERLAALQGAVAAWNTR